ncbi:methionine--tRNA ligase subunit beta [Thermogladius calderae]|uniref:methionine--tRNA ligase subunit beta n=1 Tax=Thermogladius calderae TaxID=1200300 RepID=UPI0012FF0475|nr:methionine--tRNA ligase subunit beta [Thermogladius calderae]
MGLSNVVEYEDFAKLDLRVGLVKHAERVQGSKKLIKLVVDLGELGERQLVAGLAEFYKPEEFVNKYVIVVANLKPKKIFGLDSQGMILATDTETPVLLTVEKPVKPGSRIR